VPVARGEAAQLAGALGLGLRTAATRLLREQPPEEWVDAVEGEASDTLLWPVAGGTFHRGFGYVRQNLRTRHDGIDIVARSGTHILAAADGLVGYSDNRVQGFGNLLIILHADGTSTLYAHCRAIFVAAGEQVRRGQVVAEVGDTGISRMPHLHFEWHRAGEAIDPEPRLVGRPR
jgi:murein DD-endopeptidase MepM/ murein hydrolase activator NlpD